MSKDSKNGSRNQAKQLTQHPKRSRFLSRIDKYINEAGSNPSLDQKFMMRESSQSHGNRASMMPVLRASNSVADFSKDQDGQSIFNITTTP